MIETLFAVSENAYVIMFLMLLKSPAFPEPGFFVPAYLLNLGHITHYFQLVLVVDNLSIKPPFGTLFCPC